MTYGLHRNPPGNIDLSHHASTSLISLCHPPPFPSRRGREKFA